MIREPESRAKLAAILNAGIRRFIDLTEADEPLEKYNTLLRSEANRLGIEVRHTRFPIADLSIPTRDQMQDILSAIQQACIDKQPVYVHCWGVWPHWHSRRVPASGVRPDRRRGPGLDRRQMDGHGQAPHQAALSGDPRASGVHSGLGPPSPSNGHRQGLRQHMPAIQKRSYGICPVAVCCHAVANCNGQIPATNGTDRR